MLIAGLTGGVACGKSFVAEELHRLGAHIVEADELGHEVLMPDGEAYAPTIQEFGPGILTPDGAIDRARLARSVFKDPAALANLNAIVHPAVRNRAQQRFREIARQDPHAVIVYVAAILIETGTAQDFDKLILVDCPRQTQIERALNRSGAELADVEARLDRQLPPEKKRPHAHYIIDTSGPKEETLRQTKIVFEDLRRLAS